MAMLRHTLGEAFLNLWRNRFINLVAAFTIAVSLAVLGLFLLLAHNLSRVVAQFGNQIRVSLYLKDDASDADRERVLQALAGRPEAAGVEFISREAARERFRKLFPALREVPDELEGNPFPASVEIAIAEGHRDPESMRRLAGELKQLPGVEEAAFDLPWVSRLREVVGMARTAGYALGGVLGLAAVLTIASVVRMTIYSRQQEIEILRLVGATRSFILAPFLLESSLLGALGGGISLGALYGLHRHLAARPASLVPVFRELLTASFLPPPHHPGAAPARPRGGGGGGADLAAPGFPLEGSRRRLGFVRSGRPDPLAPFAVQFRVAGGGGLPGMTMTRPGRAPRPSREAG